MPALDPCRDIARAAGLPLWGVQQGLVRPVAVVVPGVPGQDNAEMPLTEDQDVVEALAP